MMLTRPSQPTWILPLTSEDATLPLVGGKGANLARLARAGAAEDLPGMSFAGQQDTYLNVVGGRWSFARGDRLCWR